MSASHLAQRVLTPVVTPFDANGAPSASRLARHCRSMVDNGVGLALFGTNSEANSLSVAEKRHLLDRLIADGLPPECMMPGTGACALPDSIELTRHALQARCARALMLPPFYYKNVCDEGLFRYFATVIDTVADARLRVYLYHIPHVAQVGISLGLIERLLNAYPDVIAGIKDSSGDWANTSTMIDAFGKSGFDVLAGSETFLLQTLRAGGAGCITATANVNARRIAQLARTWQAPYADDQQQRLDALRGVFTRFPVIPAMKAAIAWQSGDENWSRVREPLVELTRAQRDELEAALTAIDFRIENAGSFAEPA